MRGWRGRWSAQTHPAANQLGPTVGETRRDEKICPTARNSSSHGSVFSRRGVDKPPVDRTETGCVIVFAEIVSISLMEAGGFDIEQDVSI